MFILLEKTGYMITKNYALVPLLFISLLLSCSDSNSDSSSIHGKYKMFSDDPAISRFIANEDNYIRVNNDNTIVYNSTINGKPKFNFKGNYTYDPLSKTLTVQWAEGKLPAQLKVELADGEHIIKIGETSYKKEKAQK
jgi:hypothetical protein